jgi:hypothetical protein
MTTINRTISLDNETNELLNSYCKDANCNPSQLIKSILKGQTKIDWQDVDQEEKPVEEPVSTEIDKDEIEDDLDEEVEDDLDNEAK